jgi:adenosylcobinamide-GDP ribazoletransferase
LSRFFLALRFLTIFPIGGEAAEVTDADLRSSTLYYPLVGGVLGIILLWLTVLAMNICPTYLAAAVTVAAWTFFTGGLHMDGLMDTFDGLGVRGDLPRRLEVMRDSRVGAFGVQAAILLLVLKTAALTFIVANPELLPVLFVAPVAGRTAMVALMATSGYARSGPGLARAMVEGMGYEHILISGLLFMLLTGLIAGWLVFAVVLYQFVVFILLRTLFNRAFGGVTGDLVGAACEIHELSVLLLAGLLL